jgi:hypothetical protein
VPILLTAGGPPLPGNANFQVWVTGVDTGLPGLLLGGLSQTWAPTLGVPLPLGLAFAGAPACTLRTDFLPLLPPYTTIGPGPGNSFALLGLPIPASPQLAGGLSLYCQAILLDPAAAGGITLSGGLRIRWR